MRRLSWWLASITRKGIGRLSKKRSLIRPRARKTKARERCLPSLSLRIIKMIQRTLMIKDKRRHAFLILLSPKTKTSQSRRTITRQKPLKVYRPRYRRNAGRRKSASDTEYLTTGGKSIMARLWLCLAETRVLFGRRNGRQIPLMMRVL
jgi:hypothetical protein